MAISHRSKKKRKQKQEEKKGPKVGSFNSSGINFQKVAHTKKNTKTDIHSWPSCVIAGYDDGKNSVFIQYRNTEGVTEQALKDIDELSGFFSEMTVGEIFTISNASYDDSVGKPTKTIEGTYKLISYNPGSIAAEKQADLDSNFVMKKLSGRNFSRPLQYEKEKELNSKKKISSIINYLDYPDLSEMNIEIGDLIEVSGTSFNNTSYSVLDIIKHNDGSQEIKVTPEVLENENRIGKITNFTHSKIDLNQVLLMNRNLLEMRIRDIILIPHSVWQKKDGTLRFLVSMAEEPESYRQIQQKYDRLHAENQ